MVGIYTDVQNGSKEKHQKPKFHEEEPFLCCCFLKDTFIICKQYNNNLRRMIAMQNGSAYTEIRCNLSFSFYSLDKLLPFRIQTCTHYLMLMYPSRVLKFSVSDAELQCCKN